MAVYVVTGKLGSGKTLVSVGKIRDRLIAGAPVATNLDIDLRHMLGPKARKTRFYRIPDKPTLDDLEAIGTGNDSYDEDKNGLLVLDECGTWFNSRSWADKSRQAVINWFLHARKLGWDIIFLIQDLSIMDKQARVALAEHVVYCRRMDRTTIPFLGGVYRLIFGTKMPMPKVHMAIVKYGDSPNSLIVERWTYTGRNLYASYDTKQAFSDDYDRGTYALLPPWYTHGLFMVPRDGRFYMRMTRIYWKRFSRPVVGLIGVVIGGAAMAVSQPEPPADVTHTQAYQASVVPVEPYADHWIVSYTRLGDDITYRLTDGTKAITSQDLEDLGVRVHALGACRARLSSGGQHVEVSC